jgi:hypothetical protein
MKTAWRPSRLGWELLIFAPEPRKAIPQQIELDRVVHVDADQFTRLVPKLVRQALSVRNGLVEVYRCHMETVPLPDGKNLVKFPAAQATRNNRCDKPGEFFHVDVSAQRLVCKLAQSHRVGIESTSDLHRVNRCLVLTESVKAKVICRRIHNPGDFFLSRLSPADHLFLTGRG